MAISTVFFDFGGTIAEQVVDPLDVWLSLSDKLHFPARRTDLVRSLARANEWFHTAVYDHRGRMEEFWRLYDEKVLESLQVPVSPELVAKIQAAFRMVEWHRVYPESREVLDELSARGYRIGVVSNAVEELTDRIRQLGLLEYFDTITHSQEARADKPDPAIFHLALRRAACDAAHAIHIGNTYEEDVVGARNAGIQPVLVDRSGRYPEADCPRVVDLRGVLELL